VEIEPVDFAAPQPEFWHEAQILPDRLRWASGSVERGDRSVPHV